MSGWFSGNQAQQRVIAAYIRPHFELGHVVTDTSLLFENHKDFSEDIGRWNVSRVTAMCRMFTYAHSFNQPLDGWTPPVSSICGVCFGKQGPSTNPWVRGTREMLARAVLRQARREDCGASAATK